MTTVDIYQCDSDGMTAVSQLLYICGLNFKSECIYSCLHLALEIAIPLLLGMSLLSSIRPFVIVYSHCTAHHLQLHHYNIIIVMSPWLWTYHEVQWMILKVVAHGSPGAVGVTWDSCRLIVLKVR